MDGISVLAFASVALLVQVLHVKSYHVTVGCVRINGPTGHHGQPARVHVLAVKNCVIVYVLVVCRVLD